MFYTVTMAVERIERVCRYVQKVCDTERHGGKCFVINHNTCILHDYDEWNSDMHDRVKTKFPDTNIICAHNPSSATSFSVVISIESRSSRLLLAFLLLGITVMTSVGAWRMVSDPLLGCAPLSWGGNLLQCMGMGA